MFKDPHSEFILLKVRDKVFHLNKSPSKMIGVMFKFLGFWGHI